MRVVAAVVVAFAVSGCGTSGSVLVDASSSPFVRAPHNEAAGTNGPWLSWHGLFVPYREDGHVTLLFAARNRSHTTVTVVAAGGPQPRAGLLRRVGVSLRLAPPAPRGDVMIAGLEPWSRARAASVAIPPGRDLWVQFDFVLRGCARFDPGARRTYNRSALLTYRRGGRTEIAPLDLRGDQITVTAPARCGTRRAWQRVLEDAYDGHLDRIWPCSALRDAERHLPVDGAVYSKIPALLRAAKRAAC